MVEHCWAELAAGSTVTRDQLRGVQMTESMAAAIVEAVVAGVVIAAGVAANKEAQIFDPVDHVVVPILVADTLLVAAVLQSMLEVAGPLEST